MKNNKTKKYLIGFLMAPIIIAPIATVVACGNSSHSIGKAITKIITPQEQIDNLFFKTSSNYPVTVHDVEINVFNTKENGFLPVTRLMIPAETAGFNDFITTFGLKSGDESNLQNLNFKNDGVYDSYFEKAIDTTIKGQDGANSQSKNNPLKTFALSKKDIIENLGYKSISDQILDYINKHSSNGEKYAILTIQNTKDNLDKDGKFTTGQFEIRLYKKAQSTNVDKLNEIISLIKNKNYFGEATNAAKVFRGFPMRKSGTVDFGSLASHNFNEEDHKEKIYDITNLPSPLPHFTKVINATGIERFGYSSVVNLTDDIKAKFDNSVFSGYMMNDAKTGVMNLVVNVTNVPGKTMNDWRDIVWNGRWDFRDNNVEDFDMETVVIPLPNLTKFASGDVDLDGTNKLADINLIRDKLIGNNAKFSPLSLYKSMTGLSGAVGQLGNFSLASPAVKQMILGFTNQIGFIGNVSTLMRDDVFYNNLINWIKANKTFDFDTFQNVLVNSIAIPSSPGMNLTNTTLFAVVNYLSNFYRFTEEFVAQNPTYTKQLSLTDSKTFFDNINYEKASSEMKSLIDSTIAKDASYIVANGQQKEDINSFDKFIHPTFAFSQLYSNWFRKPFVLGNVDLEKIFPPSDDETKDVNGKHVSIKRNLDITKNIVDEKTGDISFTISEIFSETINGEKIDVTRTGRITLKHFFLTPVEIEEKKWNDFLTLHNATISTLKLDITKDRNYLKTEVEYYEFDAKFHQAIIDSATKLGFLGHEDMHKEAILVEAIANTNPLFKLQKLIDDEYIMRSGLAKMGMFQKLNSHPDPFDAWLGQWFGKFATELSKTGLQFYVAATTGYGAHPEKWTTTLTAADLYKMAKWVKFDSTKMTANFSIKTKDSNNVETTWTKDISFYLN